MFFFPIMLVLPDGRKKVLPSYEFPGQTCNEGSQTVDFTLHGYENSEGQYKEVVDNVDMNYEVAMLHGEGGSGSNCQVAYNNYIASPGPGAFHPDPNDPSYYTGQGFRYENWETENGVRREWAMAAINGTTYTAGEYVEVGLLSLSDGRSGKKIGTAPVNASQWGTEPPQHVMRLRDSEQTGLCDASIEVELLDIATSQPISYIRWDNIHDVEFSHQYNFDNNPAIIPDRYRLRARTLAGGSIPKNELIVVADERYTDHERDRSTGFNYMKGRYQLASLATFNRPDPMRDWDWPNPNSLNLYQYVRNNPLNMTDPTGFDGADFRFRQALQSQQGITEPNLVTGVLEENGGVLAETLVGAACDVCDYALMAADIAENGAHWSHSLAALPLVTTSMAKAVRKGAGALSDVLDPKTVKNAKKVVEKKVKASGKAPKKPSKKTGSKARAKNTEKGIPAADLGPSGEPKIHVKKNQGVRRKGKKIRTHDEYPE